MERKFIFENFTPSSSTQRYCSQKFSQIWNKAPSDADVAITVMKDKNKHLYRTKIRINASKATVVSDCEDKAVLISVSLAIEKAHQSLAKWTAASRQALG